MCPTLQHRLVMLVAAALVPLFGLSIMNALLDQKAAINKATSDLTFTATLVAANQSRLADSAHQILLAISTIHGLHNGDVANCQRYLHTLTSQFPVYANLGFIGLDGYLLCASEKHYSPVFLGDRDYFQKSLKEQRFMVTGYKIGRLKGKSVIIFSMPALDNQGQISAIVFAAIDLDHIAKEVSAIPLPKGSHVIIMDREATLLAVNPPSPSRLGQLVPLSMLQEAVKTMRTGVEESLDPFGHKRIFSFLPAGRASEAAFFVSVSANKDGVLAPAQQQLKLELAVLTLVAMLGAWLAWRMGGRVIVAPAMALLEATQQLQKGQLHVRLSTCLPGNESEFCSIAAGFNQMAESLQQQHQALEAELAHSQAVQKKLQDSEQRYVALFESAPVPMCVYDLESTRFLTVNQVAIQRYGYSSQEFMAMTLLDICPHVGQGQAHLHLSATEENAARRVWQHRRKDGSVFFAHVFSQSIQYAGKTARFAVALDISAQLKAEQEVQEYLFTLQRAADAAQAITWHQTLEGTMQEIVDQARGVIGAHQAAVSLRLGDSTEPPVQTMSLSEKYATCQNFKAPPGRAGMEALVCQTGRALHLTQAELEAHPRWQHNLKAESAAHASDYFPMRGWLAVPMTGRGGENIGLLQLSDKYQEEFTQQDKYVAIELAHLASIAVDKTRLLEEVSRLNAGLEQKVAERTAELARQEALFRALAEQAPQSVWTASPKGAATYFNRAWFDLMGGELKDWIGNQWLAAVHPEDIANLSANWHAANLDQASYSGTRRLLAKDGHYHTMAYRASAVRDEQGELMFWVGIDADITEIKAIEAALRLSNQELEAFSYSVSHDLRSPLNTIDGFSRLLAKQLAGETNEKVIHYLSRIQAGVAQMGQLIEDLLSLSQLTRTQLRSESLDISIMIQGIFAEWQASAPGRQVTTFVQANLRAEGDERLIKVALRNLLANAWKFTSQRECAEISVDQTIDSAGFPVFLIRDNGAGFDMAYADKLFVPFQRLHAASEFPGTGIGLAIVSRVIERHGGRLWAESAPGCGATFFFTLPHARLPV